MSECFCFIFYVVFCLFTFDDRFFGEGEECIMCKFVFVDVMFYGEKDFFCIVIILIYIFLK